MVMYKFSSLLITAQLGWFEYSSVGRLWGVCNVKGQAQ